jgi:hypothetical protein
MTAEMQLTAVQRSVQTVFNRAMAREEAHRLSETLAGQVLANLGQAQLRYQTLDLFEIGEAAGREWLAIQNSR